MEKKPRGRPRVRPLKTEEELARRAQGKPLTLEEVTKVIEDYIELKTNKQKNARLVLHEKFGISLRKIGELIRDFRQTKEIPEPKQKVPWNKGLKTKGLRSVTEEIKTKRRRGRPSKK